MPVRAVALFLVLAASHLLLARRSAAADDAPRPTARLAFACAADNDIYRALGGAEAGVARFDTAEQAVAAAPEGGGVLILADGYPARRTPFAPGLLDRAAARKLRLYVEYPEAFPGLELGVTRGVKWERGVVASDALGKSLPPMRILGLHDCQFITTAAPEPILVLSRVAGFDTAVYGLPPERFPVLIRPRPDVFVATTKLSDFVRGRYAPSAAWKDVWRQLLARLDPAGAPHALAVDSAVRPAFAKDAMLPPGAERAAAGRFAGWLLRSNLLVAPQRAAKLRKMQADGVESIGPPAKDEPTGDGSLGILEGYASNILPGGGQMRRIPIRADCQTESAAVLAMHSLSAGGDAKAAAVAKNLLDFTYVTSGMCKGGRGNPAHPAYGLIAWGDVAPAWTVANYGDDNARVLLGTMLAAACLRSDAWDEAMLRGLLANLRTTGRLGFRTDRVDMPQLEQHGWRYYNDASPVNIALNFEAYPWACFLWAYHQTGHREFLEKARSAIRITMEGYPDKWRWGDNMERARMLLPLAWLVRVEDTPEHRGWLMRIASDLIAIQEACGALPERLKGAGGGHYVIPASNDAYGTTETPLIQQNGDTVSDQLYTAGFALLGLHEAAAATGDAKLRAAADKLAAYLVRIQVRSDDVAYVDGAWFRAFDYGKWDYWASSADIGWGAWSIEAGWCQAWTAVTLDLRARGTSFWELTEGSRIEDKMPSVQKLMAVNTGGPWGDKEAR
jgi:hypothetical protein